LQPALRLSPPNIPSDGGPSKTAPFSQPASLGEDLPYKVELWDVQRTAVERTLAVTSSASIGYGAFYAAAREFPERYITLKHKNEIISRSNQPTS
jgi:hypothetical protein